MADDNTIILKLQLEEAQSKVKIKKLNQDLNELDGRTKEYRESVAPPEALLIPFNPCLLSPISSVVA